MNEKRADVRENSDRALPFVDTVRFWTMFAVVFGHCAVVFGGLGPDSPFVMQIVSTPFRFGTIGFFLISGLLLGNKLRTDRSIDYLRRRVKRLFVPWLFWYLLLVTVVVFRFHHFHGVNFHLDAYELRLIGQHMYESLFLTAFWFVPNLLLGIVVLLAFERHMGREMKGYGR